MEQFLLIITVLLTSLTAGVFFGYSTSVNWALRKLKDDGYIRTMQHINKVIENPLFLAAFMLPLLLLPLVAFLYGGPLNAPRFMLLAGAAFLYIIGTFGVTVAGNIPLNKTLDAIVVDSASPEELSAARKRFEGPWNGLHTIRTLFAIASVVLLVWALL